MTRDINNEIICVGEILWDGLPSGLYLGGAPLNVCLHLHNLGEQSTIFSRVGDDRLGKEALRRLRAKGLSTELIQIDNKRETGFVAVELDRTGDPNYQFIEPTAWDYISPKNALYKRLDKAWGIVFGSLAQRNGRSRNTIQQLLNSDCHKVFDVNLRAPHFNRDIIETSLYAADILKINESELEQLYEWFKITKSSEGSVRMLAQKFDCPVIAVTRGAEGAELLYHDSWFSCPSHEVNVADTVGAGDAFTAALLSGIKSGKTGKEIIAFANAAGAYVASKNGAIPAYDTQEIKAISNSKMI
ncbi:MAG TPA: carbohydrate kinase [Balneolaceae bacterium]|nr:carbohydrate kinase [Balneolaceae bacterium]